MMASPLSILAATIRLHTGRTTRNQASRPLSWCTASPRRPYFTNADRMRQDDPYAVLGLTYGDGCTVAEIKAAFREKAKQLHPDANNGSARARSNGSIKSAQQEFQNVLKAYETLTKIHTNLPGLDASKDDEWKTAVWRRSDRIAVNRTDVAGVKRVRPLPSPNNKHRTTYVLGHPQRGGVVSTRQGEYLEQDNSGGNKSNNSTISSSVGRGQSKWVTRPKTYTPWNKNDKV